MSNYPSDGIRPAKNGARNRPSFGRPLTARGLDMFDTPPIALAPLFAHERLLDGVTTVCEPFCGKGNLVIPMRARGLTVHASDIVDRGCPDSTVLDFLKMTTRPCDTLISNCAYAGAMDFIEHAVEKLNFRIVALLLSPSFLFTARRFERLHKPGHLRCVHVLAERLQDMHDANYTGEKASQNQTHAWYVFDRDYCGPAVINPVSIHRPTERMPWAPPPAIADQTRETVVVSSEPPAHSPFGGSSAPRVIKCPASVGLIKKVPAHILRKSSNYADRGTALHVATARLIKQECTLDDLVGATIGNYTVTRDDVEDLLRPVLAFVDALLDTGAEFLLEARVEFPGVPNAFGTADLLIRIGGVLHVIDFKYGSGVRVLALYPDGDVDVVNAQTAYYGVATLHTFPKFCAGVNEIALTILQPVSIVSDAEMVSTVTVTRAELDEFAALFAATSENALSSTPRLARGDHCRFCPARPICPEHTGPLLLDLAPLEVPKPSAADYHRVLAAILSLADATKDIIKAAHDQAKQSIHDGHTVPGYTLSAGRAVREWANETTAAPDLLKLGLARDDVLTETLHSPAQVEKRARARGVKIPKVLINSRPSGVSLVRVENARAPVPGRSEIVQEFARALMAFEEGN